jgi:hypothetical protein
MLMTELRGEAIVALDGRIGSLDDLFIDARRWAVRYLVVDTGHWLPGRRVLLAPQLVAPPAPAADGIAVGLSREAVKNCPDVTADPPVSELQQQAAAHRSSRRTYWEGHVPLGAEPAQYPAPFGAEHPDPEAGRKAAKAEEAARRSHVWSACDLLDCSVVGYDGACGHVSDLAVNERSWTLDTLIVDRRTYFTGEQVLISPGAIEQVDWEANVVHVALTHEQIARLPSAAY